MRHLSSCTASSALAVLPLRLVRQADPWKGNVLPRIRPLACAGLDVSVACHVSHGSESFLASICFDPKQTFPELQRACQTHFLGEWVIEFEHPFRSALPEQITFDSLNHVLEIGACLVTGSTGGLPLSSAAKGQLGSLCRKRPHL